MTAPQRRPWLKPALHAAGFLAGLLAIAFVVMRLRDYSGQIDLARLSTGTLVSLGALAVVSGLANVFLGLAWWRLLRMVDLHVKPLWAIRAHGVSQLARYVPGNVLQFAGRQAIGLAAGLPGVPLARSVLWELAVLAVTGGLYALVAAPLLVPAVPSLIALPAFLAALWLARWRFGLPLMQALLADVGLLTLNGTVFVGVLALVQHQPFDWQSAPLIGGAFVLAWLIGLVTPGAPAGGGIREAVLLFLLGHRYAPGDLLLAIVLGRSVNIVGDVGYFLLASLLPKMEPRDAAV